MIRPRAERGVVSLLEMTLVLILVAVVIASFIAPFKSATENYPVSDNVLLNSVQPLDLP